MLLVDGVPQTLEVVRQPRHLGGTQAYWVCPQCSALRHHLYLRDGVLACRCCHGLEYRSRHVPAVVARAARLMGEPPKLSDLGVSQTQAGELLEEMKTRGE